MQQKVKYQVLSFGIARDITGERIFDIELEEGADIEALRAEILRLHPRFGELVSFSIAVNNEYIKGDLLLSEGDEIAIIPPVSGG